MGLEYTAYSSVCLRVYVIDVSSVVWVCVCLRKRGGKRTVLELVMMMDRIECWSYSKLSMYTTQENISAGVLPGHLLTPLATMAASYVSSSCPKCEGQGK